MYIKKYPLFVNVRFFIVNACFRGLKKPVSIGLSGRLFYKPLQGQKEIKYQITMLLWRKRQRKLLISLYLHNLDPLIEWSRLLLRRICYQNNLFLNVLLISDLLDFPGGCLL